MKDYNKIFCIGLPRTGTTSFSIAMDKLGFRVVHCLFSNNYDQADVFSDTPIYLEYKELDIRFPNSKFIYLNRDVDSWSLSFIKNYNYFMHKLQQKKYYENILEHKITRETYKKLFGTLDLTSYVLKDIYVKHKKDVMAYFNNKNNFLEIDISKKDSYNLMLKFLNMDINNKCFPHVNKNGDGSGWDIFLKNKNKKMSKMYFN